MTSEGGAAMRDTTTPTSLGDIDLTDASVWEAGRAP